MAKKKYILGIVGSPRINGNTDFLVTSILDAAAEEGCRVEKINLNKSRINPCQACDHCKTHVRCIQKDDMQMLNRKLRKADGIVLGTPAYFWQETAQTKIFIDRLYAFYDKDFKLRIRGKKRGAVVFIWGESGRSAARTLKPVVKYLEKILTRVLKADLVGRIVAGGIPESCDASASIKLIRNAEAIGKKMARSLHK
ncbi:MAG: flavodoxin family protein [candidate division WOR-3 bacterium]|nr:flavodoxin family protein [candidate division WOR-3 bacterium]